MKKITFLGTLLITLLLISCQKEEAPVRKESGHLLLKVIPAIQVNEVNSHLKAAPELEDFKVIIYQSDGTEIMVFDSTTVRPDTIELELGDYYVEAHSDNNLPAAFDNPYYYGISEVFTIGSNTRQTVVVSCLLANTMVSVLYSDPVVDGFSAYQTTVSSALDSLVFLMGETRMGFFQTLPLEIRVDLAYQKPDGTEVSKSMYGSIPFPLANRHYQIYVDASIAEGLAAFQITMDTSEVAIEQIEIADTPVLPPAGAIGYGDLLITEIMYNPTALSDTYGEWFEVYNNTDHSIQLQNLILGRDDANRHTIADPLELMPGSYLVFERSDTATLASQSYLFGSDLLLPNTGAVLSIFNEGTESNPGALIFSVDYGEVDFPEGSGASIALSPDRLTSAEAILGSSWCLSTSPFFSGDLGTPGAVNEACQ